MAEFGYEAIGPAGDLVKGSVEAPSVREARARLRQMGLAPVLVGEAQTPASGAGRWGLGGRVSRRELCLMTRQMSALLGAGAPLAEALEAMSRQAQSPGLRAAMDSVLARVSEGSTLARAMESRPDVFPAMYCALVAAGEKSGGLDTVMERLADYYERSEDLRVKLALSAAYPVLVVLFAMVAVMGLMTFVTPKMAKVFARTGQELPLLTKGLMASGAFASKWGLLTLAGLAVCSVASWKYIAASEKRKRKAHQIALSLPLAGPVIKNSESAAITAALAILLSGRTPLIAALNSAAAVAWTIPMREAMLEACAAVTEGTSLAGALERAGALPPVALQFIATGERNGRLDQMVEKAAAQLARELEFKASAFMAVLGPGLIIGMGLVVLLIALGVLMPIFEMNQLVR